MKTKLTLYWEEDFKKEAKEYAKSRGTSLSAMVEETLKKWIKEK